jgi:hypothetical protein
MDPISIAALSAAAVGGGLQAAGSIMAGREQEVAHKFEAQQLDAQARAFKTRAAQAEAARREDLSSVLQTAAALRAGRGVGMGSPTAEAIFRNAVEAEERNILTERANLLQEADTSRMSAQIARRKGKASLLAGSLGAAEALAGTAYKASLPYLKPGA